MKRSWERAERDQQRLALLAWFELHTPPRAIAATLTFDRCPGSELLAQRAFREFSKRLNRAVLKHAPARFGKRLIIIPVLEGGPRTGKHYHYHALIEVPAGRDEAEICRSVTEAWRRVWGSGTQIKLEPYRSSGWLKYMLKDRDKNDLLDAVDVCNLHFQRVVPVAEASFLRDTTADTSVKGDHRGALDCKGMAESIDRRSHPQGKVP